MKSNKERVVKQSKKEEIELLTLEEDIGKRKEEKKKKKNRNNVRNSKQSISKKVNKQEKIKRSFFVKGVCAILVFIVFGFILFLFGQRILVKNEIKSLEKMVVTSKIDYSQLNKTLKRTVSIGNYRKVELSFKSYLQDVVKTTKDINVLTEKEKLSNVLSAENIKADGRKFENTMRYIQNTKKELVEKLNFLIQLMDREKIMSYIENKHLSKKYISFYKEVAIEENENLKVMQESLKNSLNYYVNMFDTFDKAIAFLKNSKNWKIENNKLVFGTSKDYDNYNKIVEKLDIE